MVFMATTKVDPKQAGVVLSLSKALPACPTVLTLWRFDQSSDLPVENGKGCDATTNS